MNTLPFYSDADHLLRNNILLCPTCLTIVIPNATPKRRTVMDVFNHDAQEIVVDHLEEFKGLRISGICSGRSRTVSECSSRASSTSSSRSVAPLGMLVDGLPNASIAPAPAYKSEFQPRNSRLSFYKMCRKNETNFLLASH